jgi:hypothetical protein
VTDVRFQRFRGCGRRRPVRGAALATCPPWRQAAAVGFGLVMSATAAVAEGTLTLPKVPDPAVLSSGYPQCDHKQVMATLRKCARDLEFFRTATLEGYNRANEGYVRTLNRFDARLEIAHGSGQVSADQYGLLHDDLKDSMDDATLSKGAFRATYDSWLKRYQGEARQVKAEIDVCIVSPACQL